MLSETNGLVLYPVGAYSKSHAFYFNMDSAIIEMGTALCGHHLCHPRELPVG
jgi:hypothetical protein